MKLKKLTALVLSLVLAMGMVACGSGETATTEPSTNESTTTTGTTGTETTDEFVIGFSNCSQDTPFFANMTPIIEEYAATKGVKVVSLNAGKAK